MRYAVLAALLLALAAPAFAADVAVTRFHTAESLAGAAPGPIAVRAGAGLDDSVDGRAWIDAVAAALSGQGFTVVADTPRIAVVTLDRIRVEGERARSNAGVSVGVGVGSGGYYGGWGRRGGGLDLGLGIGFLLGGHRPREVYDTTLTVTIEDPAGAHAWEGRAEATVRAPGKKDDPHALPEEMAARLFAGFPGESGATIGAR